MENLIQIWSLGGVATKICKRLRSTAITGDGVIPTFSYVYMDTSKSELAYIPNTQELNLIKSTDGLTGSGGNRGRNYASASEQVPAIVSKSLIDGTINFLVFSTGGGSGSTLAFVTLQALIEAGEPVMCFISNTTDTMSRSHNAVTALASIDQLAKRHNVVIPCFVYDTVDTKTFSENDALMVKDLILTAGILSKTVTGMDDMDRHTGLNPMLSGRESLDAGVKALSLYEGNTYTSSSPTVSVISLVEPGTNDNIGTDAPLLFSGILSPEFKRTLLNNEETQAISLILSESALNTWVSEINEKLEMQKKKRDTRFKGKDIGVSEKVSTKTNDDGFTY